MKAIIALTFLLLLGFSIRGQGWMALLWVPSGYVLGLYFSTQILLPFLLGLPRAIRLVSTRKMRPAVLGAVLLPPVSWFLFLVMVGVLLDCFWPKTIDLLDNNWGFNLGANLAFIGIMLSLFTKASRADYRRAFDKTYGRFAKEAVQTGSGNG